ncbi:MAG: pyrroline-5-carboxylate reductase [Prevotellaceae bacterium]|jgi:pyrroline-5-carboxylate reductase|nr:pyrroline-5-carboxylate reductase [Prevotellaceae bacterium]
MIVGIIGAGNMGGAIVRGLIQSKQQEPANIFVADPNEKALATCADLGVKTTNSNVEAAQAADLLILAVKPWLAQEVLHKVRTSMKPATMLASVVAGLTLDTLDTECGAGRSLFRIMPNTAIAIEQSMTFISSLNASKEQEQMVADLFSASGKVLQIPEKQMSAATSLASCGIAYAMRYISASMRAGVELGFTPDSAKEVVLQTLLGAALLLQQSGQHPEVEIDKVTTPNGLTIKGLNELEHAGFSSSIIKALKTSM